MKKQKKLDKVKLTKELSRDRIGRVRSTQKIENKKKDIKDDSEMWNWSLYSGLGEDYLIEK